MHLTVDLQKKLLKISFQFWDLADVFHTSGELDPSQQKYRILAYLVCVQGSQKFYKNLVNH
jgi:hypothetical protein